MFDSKLLLPDRIALSSALSKIGDCEAEQLARFWIQSDVVVLYRVVSRTPVVDYRC